jgi:hypothetical protein
MIWSRGPLLVLTAAAAVLLGYLALHLLGVLHDVPVQDCVSTPPAHQGDPPQPPLQPLRSPLGSSVRVEWRWVLLGACFAGFVAGNSSGHARADGQVRRLAAAGAPEPDDAAASPGLRLQLLLTGLLLAAVLALGYETFALAGAQSPDRWPITFYARCANDVAPWWTLAGAVTVSILLGHWLAYQPRPRPAA